MYLLGYTVIIYRYLFKSVSNLINPDTRVSCYVVNETSKCLA